MRYVSIILAAILLLVAIPTGAQDNFSVQVNEAVTVTAAPDPGFVLDSWFVNAVAVGTTNPKTFTIKNVGFDYSADKTLEPSVLFPQILKLDRLSKVSNILQMQFSPPESILGKALQTLWMQYQPEHPAY